MANPFKNKYVLYGTIAGVAAWLWFKYGKKKKTDVPESADLGGGGGGGGLPNIIFPIFGTSTKEDPVPPPAPEVEDLGQTTVTNTAPLPINTSGCADTFTIYESGLIKEYKWNNGQPTVTKTIEPVAMFTGELNAIGSGINTPITTSITLAEFQAACDKKKTGNYDGGGGGSPIQNTDPIPTLPTNDSGCPDQFILYYKKPVNYLEKVNWNNGSPKKSYGYIGGTLTQVSITVSEFKALCDKYKTGNYNYVESSPTPTPTPTNVCKSWLVSFEFSATMAQSVTVRYIDCNGVAKTQIYYPNKSVVPSFTASNLISVSAGSVSFNGNPYLLGTSYDVGPATIYTISQIQ